MSTSAVRSGVTVKEEMPASYFEPIEAMMESNSAVCTLPLTPRTAAIALVRSTS